MSDEGDAAARVADGGAPAAAGAGAARACTSPRSPRRSRSCRASSSCSKPIVSMSCPTRPSLAPWRRPSAGRLKIDAARRFFACCRRRQGSCWRTCRRRPQCAVSRTPRRARAARRLGVLARAAMFWIVGLDAGRPRRWQSISCRVAGSVARRPAVRAASSARGSERDGRRCTERQRLATTRICDRHQTRSHGCIGFGLGASRRRAPARSAQSPTPAVEASDQRVGERRTVSKPCRLRQPASSSCRASAESWVVVTDARGPHAGLPPAAARRGRSASTAWRRSRCGSATRREPGSSFRGQPVDLAASTRDNVASLELK